MTNSETMKPEAKRVPHAYEAVATELRAEILQGTWPAGSLLPTIPDLVERFGVSPITVRGGLQQLAAEGLVYTGYANGRRGTIVRSRRRIDHYVTDALRPDRPASNWDSFSEQVLRAGRTPTKRFMMKIETAPPEIAARLGLAPDELLVQRTVYQMVDGEPYSRERSYFPLDLAREVGLDTPHDIPQGTLRRLREVGYAEEAFVDEAADQQAGPEEAQDLFIPVGTTLSVQTRTAATATRLTRVTQTIRLGGRSTLIWETGADAGLNLIRSTREHALNGKNEAK
jgi:GntR family transcriptional regulator